MRPTITPAPIHQPGEVTPEHVQWLLRMINQQPLPISAANLTKAVGHTLKRDAKSRALDTLLKRGAILIHLESHYNGHRTRETTFYSLPNLAEWLS